MEALEVKEKIEEMEKGHGRSRSVRKNALSRIPCKEIRYLYCNLFTFPQPD